MDELTRSILNADILVLIIGMLLTLIVKDLVETLSKGLLFVLNKNFNVGDKIFYNGKQATIISIGWRQSIFEYEEDGVKIWLYLYNDRIKYQNLGKIKDKYEKSN